MKKNFSVNIGGRVFNIDDDAYERLNNYLNNLRLFFATDPGREEIIADIEGRIAELLEQKKTQGFSITTLEHINEVIASMGEPEEVSGKEKEGPAHQQSRTPGKLFRDPDHRQVGGVAAGIAAWFGIDPAWIRIGFVVLTFFYGIGVILYLILWLILPQARTTTERLEMQRQTINIDNLRNEVASTGKGLQRTSNSVMHSFGKILRFFTEVITYLFHLFLKVLRLAGGAFMVLLVLAIIIGLGLTYIIRDTFSTGFYHLDSITQADVFSWLIPGTSVLWLAYLAIILFVLGIAGMFIYLGLRLMLKWPPIRWQILVVFGVLILAGLVFGGGAAYQYSRSMAERASNSKVDVYATKSHQIHLTMASMDLDQYWKPLGETDFSKHSQEVLGEMQLSIRPAPGDSVIITAIREASSYRENMAATYLESISYTYSYQDTLITFNPYFSIPKSEGMRHQTLELILGIPVNTVVRLDDNLAWKVNFRDFNDNGNGGGEYIMTSSGLKLKEVPKPVSDTTAQE
ncbi:MAG: PspC domain-containing protein [Bacteroidetes bacterium]|nr:PspC domain-containing protein [Bacteroidota bacterium]